MKLLSGVIELAPGYFLRLPYPMTRMEMSHYRFGPLAIPLMVAGTTVAAAGAIQAGRAAEAEGKSAQNITDYNAAIQEAEARAVRQKAGFEQRRQAKRGARIKSALTAKIAAAGGLGSPVAADLVAEQAAELELENLLIGYEGEVGAQRALSQAQLDRLQGKLYRQKGKAATQASYFEAGTTLLTGFGEAGVGAKTPHQKDIALAKKHRIR